ncbi:hypothetical protein [Streptosporangium sp. NPDC004631]
MAVWCGATVLASSITWFGVRDVLRSQVFDDARIEPLGVALTRVTATPHPSELPSGPRVVPARPSVSPPPRGRTPRASTVSPAPARDGRRPRVIGSPSWNAGEPVRPKVFTTPDPQPFGTAVPRSAQGSP